MKTAYKLNLIVLTIKLKCCVFCCVCSTYTHIHIHTHIATAFSLLFSVLSLLGGVYLYMCLSVVAKALLVCYIMQAQTYIHSQQNPLIGQQNCFVCSVAEFFSSFIYKYTNTFARTYSYWYTHTHRRKA